MLSDVEQGTNLTLMRLIPVATLLATAVQHSLRKQPRGYRRKQAEMALQTTRDTPQGRC